MTKKAIKWMNTFDLARSKEMEKIILNWKEVIILYRILNAFDKENRLSQRHGKVV